MGATPPPPASTRRPAPRRWSCGSRTPTAPAATPGTPASARTTASRSRGCYFGSPSMRMIHAAMRRPLVSEVDLADQLAIGAPDGQVAVVDGADAAATADDPLGIPGPFGIGAGQPAGRMAVALVDREDVALIGVSARG